LRRFIKILGIGGLLLTLFLVVMGFRGRSIAASVYDAPGRLLESLPDSVDVAEGARLATIHACHDCHGEDLSGRVLIDAPPFLVVAGNLTGGVGGVAGAYRGPSDWDRAIRYRIRPDGRGLLPMMPSENYHWMSDADVSKIIAYVTAVSAVDNELPETRLRAMGLPIAGFGVLHPSREQGDAPGGPTPSAAPSAAYGAYLSNLACVECHGGDLQGGPTPGGGPKAPTLAGAGRWPLETFMTAMRDGVALGRTLDPAMPISYLKHMTDLELEALHKHMATLELGPG